jgi:5-methylcytosine-specific restriction endonuclease McrA
MTFSKKQNLDVFNKATKIKGKDPKEWRRDSAGNTIKFTEYGKNSKYGWQIDHIIPKAKNGSDHIDNLQPLQWEENVRASDKTDGKPGFDSRALFNALQNRAGGPKRKIPCNLTEGDSMWVKYSPTAHPSLAVIIRINKEEDYVTVRWDSNDTENNIVYDGSLFEKISKRRTR